MLHVHKMMPEHSGLCCSCQMPTEKDDESFLVVINNGEQFDLCQDCATRLTNEISTLLLDKRPKGTPHVKTGTPLDRAISSVEETLEVDLALDMQEVVSDFIKEAFLLEVTLPDGTSVRATKFMADTEEETLYCRYCDEELHESDAIRGAEEGDGIQRCPKCGNELVHLEKDDPD